MRKTLVALVVATALVAAAPADAHTMSITTARAVTAASAHQQFVLAGWADDWGVGDCRQVSVHAVDCHYWLRRKNEDSGGCTWNQTLRVYYASESERTPSTMAVGSASCDSD
ncbi:MAG: hypothetical protein ACJ76S_13985 [Solirubrobacteraceae bacterium]|jgi:hypothetical protein